jgi:hypothetical protein
MAIIVTRYTSESRKTGQFTGRQMSPRIPITNRYAVLNNLQEPSDHSDSTPLAPSQAPLCNVGKHSKRVNEYRRNGGVHKK